MEISEHCSSDPPEAVLCSAPTSDHSGNKLTHRGYHGASQEIPHLLSSAKEVGYPLLIKPTHGGGGKGMRVVHNHEVLEEEIMIAKREALKSFGNDEVLLERWLERPRHVEVQVFADTQGGVVSLWERDCSVQRRHQSESRQRAERAGLDPSGGMVVEARVLEMDQDLEDQPYVWLQSRKSAANTRRFSGEG
jgi:carbamoylphosphate synthase large subunit